MITRRLAKAARPHNLSEKGLLFLPPVLLGNRSDPRGGRNIQPERDAHGFFLSWATRCEVAGGEPGPSKAGQPLRDCSSLDSIGHHLHLTRPPVRLSTPPPSWSRWNWRRRPGCIPHQATAPRRANRRLQPASTPFLSHGTSHDPSPPRNRLASPFRAPPPLPLAPRRRPTRARPARAASASRPRPTARSSSARVVRRASVASAARRTTRQISTPRRPRRCRFPPRRLTSRSCPAAPDQSRPGSSLGPCRARRAPNRAARPCLPAVVRAGLPPSARSWRRVSWAQLASARRARSSLSSGTDAVSRALSAAATTTTTTCPCVLRSRASEQLLMPPAPDL